MSLPKISKRKHFADQNEPDIDIPDGDPIVGKSYFKIHCAGCHHLYTNGNMGPRLADIYLKKVGTTKGFHYSKTMYRAGFNWTKKQLFIFLEDPGEMFHETNMIFDGIKDPWIRACIIEYLHYLKDQKKIIK